MDFGVIFAVTVVAYLAGIGTGIWACFRARGDMEELKP